MQSVGRRSPAAWAVGLNRKTRKGSDHADRDAPQRLGEGAQSRNQPVTSVDTKKKERVGGFKNAGCDW